MSTKIIGIVNKSTYISALIVKLTSVLYTYLLFPLEYDLIQSSRICDVQFIQVNGNS